MTGLPAPLNDVPQWETRLPAHISMVCPGENFLKVIFMIDEQIAILKRHGCIIRNKSFTEEILSKINYYRFSAYLIPFKGNNGMYLPDTTFERIFHIYEFDRELRSLLFQAIECIEISLRTRLSYMHGMKYGALGYLNKENFNPRHDTKMLQGNIKGVILYQTEKETSDHEKKEPFVEKELFVKHHKEKYDGQFPIWVVIELFTFGMLSRFYSDLHTSDQKQIARQYHTSYKVLESWLRCCTDVRNICAHYGRLYYRNFTSTPSGFMPKKNVRQCTWAMMLVIKSLYPFPDKWEKEFMPQMENIMDKYSKDIDLKHLGFPKNWKEELMN